MYSECKSCWFYTREYKAPGHMNRRTRCGLYQFTTIVKKCPCFQCLTKTLCRHLCEERLNFWDTVVDKG
jgi:hypothetical protein